jgi:hypothetical protein
MSRVHVLVEGQTEEQFVKHVLGPYLARFNVFADVCILVTQRRKSGETWKGGGVSLQRLLHDIRPLLGDSSATLVTTMFDYYALPDDFPGMNENAGLAGASARASVVEARFNQVVQENTSLALLNGRTRFACHLSVHEFETFLFVDPKITAVALDQPDRGLQLMQIVNAFASVEDIDGSRETCPSHRVEDMFPGYDKVFYGPLIAERVGLDRLRSSCPHFGAWVAMLEGLDR